MAREKQWLSLGDAASILGVHKSTLRLWADAGRVRCFRTPGGHRRFLKEDIYALRTRGGPSSPGAEGARPEEALRRLQRRLRRRARTLAGWMATLEEGHRQRLRALGRRLVEAITTYLERRRRPRFLRETVREVGQEYGRLLARLGFSLQEAVRTFLLFRNSMLDGVDRALQAQGGPGLADPAVRHQARDLTDEALLAMISAYAEQMGPRDR